MSFGDLIKTASALVVKCWLWMSFELVLSCGYWLWMPFELILSCEMLLMNAILANFKLWNVGYECHFSFKAFTKMLTFQGVESYSFFHLFLLLLLIINHRRTKMVFCWSYAEMKHGSKSYMEIEPMSQRLLICSETWRWLLNPEDDSHYCLYPCQRTWIRWDMLIILQPGQQLHCLFIISKMFRLLWWLLH